MNWYDIVIKHGMFKDGEFKIDVLAESKEKALELTFQRIVEDLKDFADISCEENNPENNETLTVLNKHALE